MKMTYPFFIIILCANFLFYGYCGLNDSINTIKTDNIFLKDTTAYFRSQFKYYNTCVWAIRQHEILYDNAIEKGYVVSQDEINERLEVYKKALPNIKVDINLVKRELIIEKYLLGTGEYSVDSYQIQNEYSKYKSSCLLDPIPSFEALEPILMSKALFSHEDVVKNTRQEMEKLSYQHHERRAEANKPWPIEKLRIEGPKDTCLAFLAENNSCVFTVGEFNNALMLYKQPYRYQLDTARSNVLMALLVNQYCSEQARFYGVSEEDNIEDRINEMHERHFLFEKIKSRGMGKAVLDKEVLWEIYNKYYNQLFCNYEKVDLDIIGSTDSIWVDSIYQVIKNGNRKELSNAKKVFKQKRSDSIPWIQSNSEHLPLILVSPTDTLLENEFTLPMRTSFGYFICRVAKVEKVKSFSFREAQNQCIYIATRQKYLNIMDSLINEKAYNYYKNNESDYQTPDTISVQAWLIPQDNNEYLSTHEKVKDIINCKADTSSFRSIMTTSISLPQEVRLELEKQFKKIRQRTEFIGPIKGRYSRWYFKVKNVKNGGIQLPFELVKQDIIDIIVEPFLKTENDSLSEDAKRLRYESGLSKEYFGYKAKEIEKISDKDVLALIKKGVIDTSEFKSGATPEENLNHARELLHRQLYITDKKAIQEWIASIEVDKGLLFQREKSNYTVMQK